MLITHTKIKTSIWDALTFASYFTVGVGSPVPVHREKTGGTGFQTRWGIVTNSHVMKNKPDVVLTTFHKASYRIKSLSGIKYRDRHISVYDAKQIESTAKEATLYDWGDAGIDLALIRVKVPGAFVLPVYDISERKHSPAAAFWKGEVYSTEYSRLFHRPDCNALIISPDDLIGFPSKDDAITNGGVACPECNP